MIELLKQHISTSASHEEKVNKAVEFLQILVLKIIYDKGYFSRLSFTGGTALRILYDLKRFSEDLDFSLVEKSNYDFTIFKNELMKEISLYGLTAEEKTREIKTVYSSLIKFSGLLKQLGLSPLKDQKLSIKIEIDSNPPKGGELENSLVNKVYTFNILHFNLSSLFATKLHACFFRKYTKGRDLYDLLWYLTKKIEPNYPLLNNAIKQTQGIDLQLNKSNLNKYLIEKIEKIDFATVKKDVERFLEDKKELKLLDLKTLKNLISKKY